MARIEVDSLGATLKPPFRDARRHYSRKHRPADSSAAQVLADNHCAHEEDVRAADFFELHRPDQLVRKPSSPNLAVDSARVPSRLVMKTEDGFIRTRGCRSDRQLGLCGHSGSLAARSSGDIPERWPSRPTRAAIDTSTVGRELDDALKLLDSPSYEERVEAVRRLSALDDPRALEGLVRALHDTRDTAVVQAAAESLLQRFDSSAMSALTVAMESDDFDVTQTVGEVLESPLAARPTTSMPSARARSASTASRNIGSSSTMRTRIDRGVPTSRSYPGSVGRYPRRVTGQSGAIVRSRWGNRRRGVRAAVNPRRFGCGSQPSVARTQIRGRCSFQRLAVRGDYQVQASRRGDSPNADRAKRRLP